MPASDAVLAFNAGSSSIKFGVCDIKGRAPALLCKGRLDEHEAKPRLAARSPSGETLSKSRGRRSAGCGVLSAFTCAHEYAETYRSPK
ncbi:hypothetical protein XH90_27030 [Bradyrhizobium sp. CCBAU 53338]|nr:hypothetical protein XH90_27030 [Bradyrhizobium sp. CCBAU 53338]